jgi:hypothetical protein
MSTSRTSALQVLLLLGIVAYMLGTAYFTYSYSFGPNYRNVSVDTTVYIGNATPIVLTVLIEGGAKNITLIAGTFKNITCNATIRDYNGGSTITNVSATFYDNVSSFSADVDDNNTHYSNTNCTLDGMSALDRNASCSFLVYYYANVNMWTCNVTATDPYTNYTPPANRQGWGTNSTHIDMLLALNVTPLIDYGNLSVGDTSNPQQANITNFGNWNINVSVRGYGSVLNDGLAMVCEFGNITIPNEKYNLIGGSNLLTYTNLSNLAVNVSGLTILQQTNDSQQVINTSWWILYVPPNPFGRCNGTVVFQAEQGK